MKRLTILLIGIQFVYLIMSSCTYRKTNDNNIKLSNSTRNEDFDEFLIKFYSDSIFQVSRIIFPLESETKIERDKELANEKDSNIEVSGKYVNHNKNNWNFLSDAYFKGDTIAVIDGVKYKRRFHKTDKRVEEKVLYADDEMVMIIVEFRSINNKWYLVDFRDGFAD